MTTTLFILGCFVGFWLFTWMVFIGPVVIFAHLDKDEEPLDVLTPCPRFVRKQWDNAANDFERAFAVIMFLIPALIYATLETTFYLAIAGGQKLKTLIQK